MKINIFSLKSGFLLFISFSVLNLSCSKVFDQDHIGAITPSDVWTSPDNIKLYVNNFYGVLPSWNRNELYTEEDGVDGSFVSSFLIGKQQATSAFPDGISWEAAYSNIRAMNVFFQNIDGVENISADEKAVLRGQVYFFRGFQYFSLLKIYGGVPIITDPQDPSDSTLTMVKRNSSAECFDFVINDLDSAIKLLPRSWSDADMGRITRGAAMAVKGKVLMVKASPLFNPEQNHPEYWQAAFDANQSVLDELVSDGYGLYTDGGANAYTKMWYDKAGAKKEMVLYVRFDFPLKPNSHQRAQRPLSVSAGESGACQPTWEMVKAYPMRNGKSIDDPTSGYDPGYFWVNRDPRFYQTIVYNGAHYGFPDEANRIEWMFPPVFPDGYGGGPWGTKSGFYCRKEIDTTLGATILNQQSFDWPIIRFAEVLLNLAECANEVGQPALSKSLIIQIRQRAGIMDSGDGNFGLGNGVGTDFKATLDAVMLERQIEFAYEGKRLWDLRRRRMFYVLNDYGTLHANGPYMADVKNTVADTAGRGLTDINSVTGFFKSLLLNPPGAVTPDSVIRAATDFVIEPIDKSNENQIRIPDSYYFWPLNPNWIQKDPNLQQNAGWENGIFDPLIH